ncbi:hypothetical protein FSP39_005484 [Pinctada imbricata]|uniref:Tyrosinase copper-binding domain-containing protein n=1 Tax=Pinctada imbricata TaxID=66713 RepID=A0AA89BLK6_PINIB|nr:hypothetical protein FSP39_005484 [Pinctada imbricata]
MIPILHAIAIVICTCATLSSGLIKYRELPDRLAVCYNQHYKACSTQTKVGLSILHRCMSEYHWKSGPQRDYPGRTPTPAATRYVNTLTRDFQPGGATRFRGKRQSRSRVRKEYRMLTNDERGRFHRALQALKQVSSGEDQSRFDMIASFHTTAETNAHGGCNFPGWHRYYLLLFERALQSVDPSVNLPYWDSTLDQYMDESAQSLIWSEDFLGNGDGAVTSGPFANWETSEGPLVRNIGVPDTQLYTHEQIFNTTRSTRMSQICNGQTDSEVDPLVNTGLEWHHGDVHVWMGGQMSMLTTSSYDPVFFMHHAFVDLIWEEFRQNSRRAGVDINRDYPTANYGEHDFHGPDAPLGLTTNLTVAEAIDDENIPPQVRYRYERRPSCGRNRDCGSDKLRCVQRGRNYICISKTLVEYQTDLQIEQATNGGNVNPNNGNTVIIRRPDPSPNNPNRGNRGPTFINPRRNRMINRIRGSTRWTFRDRLMRFGIRNTVAVIDQCPVPEHEHKPIQNTFCANGNSDITRWVYIPVRVLAQRPPGFKKYGSFPIRNGRLRTGSDIYSAEGYSRLKNSLEFGNPKAYDKCKTDHDPAGEIYIRTDGINYEGMYTEYAIVDQRLPLAISVAYVAIKAPENGKSTEVVLSAYDSCGRVCIPSCLDKRTNKYVPCSGALSVSNRSPLMYSHSFAETVLNIYDVSSQKHCPQVNNDNIYVSFFCDYTNEWPWKRALTQPGAQLNVWQNNLRKKSSNFNRKNKKNTFSGSGKHWNKPAIHKKGGPLKKCDLGNGCIIEKSNCNSPCKEGKNYVCLKRCNMFASCQSGRYYVKKCYSSHYSTKTNSCQEGRGHCTYSEWRLGK